MKLRTTFLALAADRHCNICMADHLKGVVIRLEPGKLMVMKGPDMKEVTYTFGPSLTLPTTSWSAATSSSTPSRVPETPGS